MNFTEYCEMAAMSDEKYHAAVEEAKKIHSVAWYISMITDDYISLDEELQELEKQRSSMPPYIHSVYYSSFTPKDEYQAVTSS